MPKETLLHLWLLYICITIFTQVSETTLSNNYHTNKLQYPVLALLNNDNFFSKQLYSIINRLMPIGRTREKFLHNAKYICVYGMGHCCFFREWRSKTLFRCSDFRDMLMNARHGPFNWLLGSRWYPSPCFIPRKYIISLWRTIDGSNIECGLVTIPSCKRK
jgi:hypothetical protein